MISLAGIKRLLIFLFSFLILGQSPLYSFTELPQEGICGPDTESSKECAETPVSPGETTITGSTERRISQTPEKQADAGAQKKTGEQEITFSGERKGFVVYFFWGRGCPHCEEEKRFLDQAKKRYPEIRIVDHEVWYDKQNAAFLAGMAKAYNMKVSGVPFTFIGEKAFVGFSKQIEEEMGESILKCLSAECVDPALVAKGKVSLDKKRQFIGTGETPEKTEDLECQDRSRTVYIPWIGRLDASEMSIPVMTVVIAGLDSFNPCAFFVLFSLLGLLVHAQSRGKMFLIGSEFVFFSGFIYFLFMAAWLNVFLVMGQVETITKTAGAIAIIIAAINIKDFFIFKKGISLTIPDSAKPKLFDRMRKLMKSSSVFSIIIGTAILAVAANSYELLCTAGFPMVYTRILTLKNLSSFSYYVYLVFYNVIYVIPLVIIVVIFTVTLGRKFLTEQQGKLLKLVSGTMMLGLGGVLLFDPAILNNAFISLLLLIGSLGVSVTIAFLMKKFRYPH